MKSTATLSSWSGVEASKEASKEASATHRSPPMSSLVACERSKTGENDWAFGPC